MAARKVRTDLCVGEIFPECGGQNGKRLIYINHSLTFDNKLLFNKCQELKKRHNVKFLWIKNGKILMRNSENSNIFVIESESNLIDIH